MPKYSISETILVEDPDFNDLSTLTELIESKMSKVSDEILDYLKKIDWELEIEKLWIPQYILGVRT